jgi:hypothetical protein
MKRDKNFGLEVSTAIAVLNITFFENMTLPEIRAILERDRQFSYEERKKALELFLEHSVLAQQTFHGKEPSLKKLASLFDSLVKNKHSKMRLNDQARDVTFFCFLKEKFGQKANYWKVFYMSLKYPSYVAGEIERHIKSSFLTYPTAFTKKELVA